MSWIFCTNLSVQWSAILVAIWMNKEIIAGPVCVNDVTSCQGMTCHCTFHWTFRDHLRLHVWMVWCINRQCMDLYNSLDYEWTWPFQLQKYGTLQKHNVKEDHFQHRWLGTTAIQVSRLLAVWHPSLASAHLVWNQYFLELMNDKPSWHKEGFSELPIRRPDLRIAPSAVSIVSNRFDFPVEKKIIPLLTPM